MNFLFLKIRFEIIIDTIYVIENKYVYAHEKPIIIDIIKTLLFNYDLDLTNGIDYWLYIKH